MRNVFLVIKHEITSMLGKRSFWIMTFLFPLLMIGLNVGVQIVSQRAFEAEEEATPSTGAQTTGYVDQAGVIERIPEGIPPQALQSFPNEEAARAALEAGELARYYVVPADVVDQGDVTLVEGTFAPFQSLTRQGLFEYVLTANLTGDAKLASRLMSPLAGVEAQSLAPEGAARDDSPLAFLVPFATMFIFFFTLTMSSGWMLQSVSKEKETRTAEVLLVSLRPRELMLGKALGLGVLALFQIAVWAGGGVLLLDQAPEIWEAAGNYALPPGFLAWMLAYFVLGYLMYASVLGAIGALAPNAREGAQFTFIVLLPLMIPLWLNTAFTQDPHGGLATFLSLFPPSAPTSMATRLAAGGVPVWQLAAGLAGLAATAYVFVLLSARLFRADTLLSDASLSWNRIVKELRRSGRRTGRRTERPMEAG